MAVSGTIGFFLHDAHVVDFADGQPGANAAPIVADIDSSVGLKRSFTAAVYDYGSITVTKAGSCAVVFSLCQQGALGTFLSSANSISIIAALNHIFPNALILHVTREPMVLANIRWWKATSGLSVGAIFLVSWGPVWGGSPRSQRKNIAASFVLGGLFWSR